MTRTTASTTARHHQTIDRYLRFWNTSTPDDRHRLASEAFTEEIRTYAPIGILDGRQALIDFREQFVRHMGTVDFRARREPEIHHGRARLMWQLHTSGEEPFATGTDILIFGPDGRIGTVTTFLDKAPEGFDPHAHDQAESPGPAAGDE
jgi:hypothetical protein